MNTTLRIETTPLSRVVAFSLVVCCVGVAPLALVGLCFAESLTSESQAQSNAPSTGPVEAETGTTIPPEELEALAAPIALYPDPLLIQVLAASTYPLEIVQLKQWMDENRKLQNKALVQAVAQQNWDPSVQSLSAFPAVVNKLANKIQWTTDLGNAFLAQQADVMDAVQRLRTKAQANGMLKTNEKQRVETETTNDGGRAITIEQAQDDVVYVPLYNTEVVYGGSGYSDYSGYSSYSGSSGYSDNDYSYVGYALAAAGGYAWGYYNWRDRYASVNYENYYNNNYSRRWNNKVANDWDKKVNNGTNNVSNSGRSAANSASKLPTQGQGPWQHNPSHRGNAPYGNSNVANRFGQGYKGFTGGTGNRTSQPATARAANQLSQANRLSQPGRGNAGNQLGRDNLSRPNGNGARGGAFGPSNGDLARSFSGRGAQSMAPSRMGPPQGLRAGGPPAGGFHGGPAMGGFHAGPPMGGGLPGGGAPPPPPPPVP